MRNPNKDSGFYDVYETRNKMLEKENWRLGKSDAEYEQAGLSRATLEISSDISFELSLGNKIWF